MKPKRLISLLVAVCMMITMLPLSAVTAFAEDTSAPTGTASYGDYEYDYTINTEDGTATITKFRALVDGSYDITIPTDFGRFPVTAIGDDAFGQCHDLQSLTIKDAATSIGHRAFLGCTSLETISLGENIKTIGYHAFNSCTSINLTNVTIPENVTTIRPGTFDYCTHLEYIMLPAGLTSFQDSLKGCPAGNPNGAIYYKNYKAAADALLADNDDNSNIDANDKLRKRNFLYLCKVTFDAKGGELNDDAEVPVYKTEKITDTKANDLTAIHDPTRAGYKFTGWYTADDQPLNVNEIITKDITFYAHWELAPKAPVCHPLTLKDGVITSVTVPGKDGADPEDITEIVKKNANEDGSFNVPEGATVSVAFDKDAFADSGLKFGHWDITGLDDPNAYQDKESFDFEMPAKAVTLKAMTQDASIEDDEPDIVGPIVIGTTVVVGGAVLGYQAYSLGAEFAGKLMALPYFPSNRSALAMMLWEDAGKPMPESELLYPDVGQEERDMDLQHAARWAMENELIPDLNDEGTAPEEMKFFPANPVSKLDVLNAWQKAQELKNN